LCLALTGVGAATVSLIEHGADEATPAPTAWLFGGFVALAMVTAAWMMRMLADYTRLRSLYRPAALTSVMIAGLALVLAVLQPSPLLFAGILFAAMCVQWVYSVNRWLETPEGRAKLAGTSEISG
jgi:Ca2+/Na+ antiporter